MSKPLTTRQPSVDMFRQLSSMSDWEELSREQQMAQANTRQMQHADEEVNQNLINKLQKNKGVNKPRPWYRKWQQGGTRKRNKRTKQRKRRKRKRTKRKYK